MDDERRSLLEQYAAARQRGGSSATSLLIAGCSLPVLDSALVCLYVGQRGDLFDRTLPRVRALAFSLSARQGWPRLDVHALARESLRHWLFDVCPTCDGRKFERIDGAPALSAHVCAGCAGTGRASLDGYEHVEQMRALCGVFDAKLSSAASTIAARFYRGL